MTIATLDCAQERRRHEVRRQQRNGLDYLEVSDDQLKLTVYFLGPAPEGLTAENLRIEGGRRVRDIRVTHVEIRPQVDPELDSFMVVTVDKAGDFSTYTLRLVDLPDDTPFDPRYRCLEFDFKPGCPSDLDCKAPEVCPPEPLPEPEISYLAKDYASFRRLILDRLAVVMPEWTERHVPDLGVTLVELLAYAGDHLSYYQDAVATEAYLGTARRRVSVRRHARLVDYRMHEGCNARAWVHIHTSADVTLPAAQLSFLTHFDELPEVEDRLLRWEDLRAVPNHRYEVFEPLVEGPVEEPGPSEAGAEKADDGTLLDFRAAHNEIRFYTWGDSECCLPRGATRATVVDAPARAPDPGPEEAGAGDEEPDEGVDEGPGNDAPEGESRAIGDNEGEDDHSGDGGPDGQSRADDDEGPDGSPGNDAPDGPSRASDDEGPDGGTTRALRLQPGYVLIFEEVIGPGTGAPGDADPRHRHAVRLTSVEPVVDELYGQPLLEIAWAEEDALPFPLCLSTIGPPPECERIEHVSVARGNVVLVDHGRRLDGPEELGCVPPGKDEARCEREGRPADVVRRAGRFRPALGRGPLTFSQPAAPGAPAARLLEQDPREALPWIRLWSRPDGECGAEPTGDASPRGWEARPDLLASGADDRHYVVEMDDRRRARLRFGDGELGRQPEAGLSFHALYRVGNGPAGNVGAGTIRVAITHELFSGVTLEPRNPLPARGGAAPEPVAEAKLFAPHAFRHVLERAITPADYAELAGRHPAVQRAAAELRWNGSWYEVRVAIDPLGHAEADPTLVDAILTHLYRFRRIGHDLAVRPARYVALDIVLEVCVDPGSLRGHVRAALRERFGIRPLADGSRGYFHPDELSFGDGISLSRLVAAAQDVPGVASVAVTRLERLFEGRNHELEEGVLPIGPLEIARLDHDPSFPENGRIRFDLRGGR